MTITTNKQIDLNVYYGSTFITTLNQRLIDKQKVSPENIELIKKSHVFKYFLFETAKNTDDVQTLKRLASLFERLEFEQQKLWGFPQDKTKHNWFDFPKCSCFNRQYNNSCIIHNHLSHDVNNIIK